MPVGWNKPYRHFSWVDGTDRENLLAVALARPGASGEDRDATP
jgi:hypothetical protein